VSPKYLSSDEFVEVFKNANQSMCEFFIKSGNSFSIITKKDGVSLNPEVEIFSSNDLHIRFDILNYSFETAEVKNGKLIFRAGFGQNENVIESEVSIDLRGIVQIIDIESNSLVFQNFSEFVEKKIDRENLFLHKNRDLFGKQ
jgi:hypothetical protein